MGLIRLIGRAGRQLLRPIGPISRIGLISPIFCFLPLKAASPDGKIHISYWEKWSGAEQLAMQEVVDEFNHSQDRITIDFLSVGQVEEKTLLATAGGDPPDPASFRKDTGAPDVEKWQAACATIV